MAVVELKVTDVPLSKKVLLTLPLPPTELQLSNKILDNRFDTNHYVYQNKTVSSYGTLDADTTGSYHGNSVSGVAAGYLDKSYSGSVVMHGVAYDANLHLSDYTNKGSEDYYPQHWANALDDASSAVVQNNSWGFTNTVYVPSTSYSSTMIATEASNNGFTANATSIDSYITSLNNFQDHGVIVFAVSNTSSLADVDLAVALPDIYSQLDESWINVINVDITGSSGSETYTRKSAPCGSTAAYCLGADGWKIGTAAYYTDDSYFVTAGSSGSSFSAPQVSGAVAIMAEAFPSQTPAQWTDRLLASADNSFFTASNTVSFANGITHGYNSEFGHGILDIYAALLPITSSKMAESILIGDNIESADIYSLSKTSINTSGIFGDAILKSFQNKNAYFYDALYGAFEYDFSGHLLSNVETNEGLLHNHFNKKKSQSIKNFNDNQDIKTNFSFVTNSNNQLLLDHGINYSVSNYDKNITASYNYPLDVNLGFISSGDLENINQKNNTSIPYIDSATPSYSTSSNIFNNGTSSISLGYLQTDRSEFVEKNAYALSFNNKDLDTSLLLGRSNENNGFLDNSFKGALTVGNNNPTNFVGFKKNKKINKGDLMFISSLGTTQINTNKNSLIKNIDDVYTSNFVVNYSQSNFFIDNSRISFSISQPQRVESGNITYDLPGLNNSDGSLNYTTYTSDLIPSGRQLDLSIKYNISTKIGMNYMLENKITNDYGHISKDGYDYQLAASMIYNF